MTDPLKSPFWRTLFALACVSILAACFYAAENWRGVKAWTNCKQELEAKGEVLDWNAYIPPPVPDEQNFFKAPKMAEWFVRQSGTNAGSDLGKRYANPETSALITTEIAASNYLAWSDSFAPDFDLIRTALKRPHARMDGDYKNPTQQPVPNFVSLRIVAQTLAQRAKCHLLLGDPEQALRDLTLIHDLSCSLTANGKSVILVTAMVRVTIAGLYVDAIATGTVSRTWREPQLVALEKQLAEINLLPDVASSLRNERTRVCDMFETLPTDQIMHRLYNSTSQSDLGWWFMPGGWVYQNMALVATLEQKSIEAFDLTNNLVLPYKAMMATRSTEDAFRHGTPWNFLAAVCIPNFSRGILTLARNQSLVDQAQIVCALERYRIDNGKYPDTLAALMPQFIAGLPHDVIGGKPMNYRRLDEQNFKLWSVGWNQGDDGGIWAETSDGKEDREAGDWLWHHPPL